MGPKGPGRVIWVLKVMGGGQRGSKGPGRAIWVLKALEGSYGL